MLSLKRTVRYLLLVGLLVTLFPLHSIAAVERFVPLINPGFEQTNTDGTVPGWSQTYGNGGISVTSEVARSGQFALKIVDPDQANYGYSTSLIPATEDLTYVATVYVQAASQNAFLYLQFHDADGVRIGHKSVAGGQAEGWTAITATLKAPAGTASVSVLLYSGLSATGVAYFDDVILLEQDDNANTQHVVRLGTAINSVTIPHAAYGQGPNGKNYIYTTSIGNPAVLTVMSSETGERVATFPLQNAGYSWGSVVAPNGHVYIGTQRNGLLYRHIPGSGTVENVGKAIDSESHIWRVASDEAGNIYGGTYPNGKVFKYDATSDTFTDYGQMAAGEKYVRSIAYGGGKVYAGTGAVQAKIVELDPATGQKQNIPLPAAYSAHKEVYDLTYTDGLLFARMTYSDPDSPLNNVTLVYDVSEGEWIHELEGTIGLDVSPVGPDGKVYFVQNGMLTSYDKATGDVQPTSFSFNGAASRGFGWQVLNLSGWNGPSLVTTTSRGSIHAYNPIANEGITIQGDPLGSANSIRSISKGPDGNIYVGGYLSPSSMTRFRLDTFTMESLRGISQVEGMGVFQDELYLGVYPGATVYKYDPELPYDSTKQSNPIALDLDLSVYNQDRPFAFSDAGGLLAIGTVPIVGKLGGAISIYDPQTDSVDVYPQIVENESPMTLAYKDGFLYGGTTVWGGISAEPVEHNGTLFIFNMNTREKVFEVEPLPGERAITSLTFGPDGMLWGLTNGKLFTFDPTTRQVVQSKELYPYTWTDIVLAGGTLNFHSDGYLYGEAAGRIFRLNPQTWEHETLVSGANYFAQDEFGRIFFTGNSIDLHMYDDIPPAFHSGEEIQFERKADGRLKLSWQGNADMKSFKVMRDGMEITARGVLTTDPITRYTSFVLPSEDAQAGEYTVTPIDYAGNSGSPLSVWVATTDLALSSLSINTGELFPAFSADESSYVWRVWPSLKSVTLTAAPQDANVIMTVNGAPAGAGMPIDIQLDKKEPTRVTIQLSAAHLEESREVTLDIVKCKGPKEGCGAPPGHQ
ncbi:cadherin-like beta sandwich domain-containing protein [Paenibacillus chungangensis]|uniref:Cadherin-like beta sandwich domain-containing protein n=1 Tax=Paenibacillus chungangensis TaxID=696535 RepID=A0ABW3HNJ5_9BACL